KAIGLFSGGLDSILAVKVLQEQDVDVVGVTFETPFFSSGRARKIAGSIDLPLRVIDITQSHLSMLKAPPHGYGKNMNPCIDCHALMLETAGMIMDDAGADFIFTGEVVGQRPMSQTGRSLRQVAKLSGYDGLVLRPLSALLLPATVPESEGKVDRQRLLDIQGRGRKRQMALADEYGISFYPAPGGGCLLTDPAFSERLRDLLRTCPDPSIRDIELLKLGRHLRISRDVKIAVGRNREENEAILGITHENDIILSVRNVPGPVVIIPGGAGMDEVERAAAVCAFYSDASRDAHVHVLARGNHAERVVETMPMDAEEVRSMIIERRPKNANASAIHLNKS
ncbi:MAG TPA: DUF814 domain-containing protein, partial [Deltaproteobacteria bacterium]|nr:DUF814 domain-containing protein [Deltaproteobacteria bacterium]